jgi:hypothetical protein
VDDELTASLEQVEQARPIRTLEEVNPNPWQPTAPGGQGLSCPCDSFSQASIFSRATPFISGDEFRKGLFVLCDDDFSSQSTKSLRPVSNRVSQGTGCTARSVPSQLSQTPDFRAPAAVGRGTQAGVATKLLSRGEALDAVDLGDDHGGQDWSHTG